MPEPDRSAAPSEPADSCRSACTPEWAIDPAAGVAVYPGDPHWEWPREPSDAELAGCWPDEDCGPPDGDNAWLRTLRADQLAELASELAAARPGAVRDAVGAGFTHRRAAAGITAGERGWQPEYVAARAAGPAAGFAAGGALDAADAGPVLAGLAQDVVDGGLGVLSDDELVGLLGAARRLSSWQAAVELSAAAELDARRRREDTARQEADLRAGSGSGPVTCRSVTSERVAAELACALTLTGRAADGLLTLARDLSGLPQVLAALTTGRIDLPKAKVFAAELARIDAVTANAIASAHLAMAGDWTTSELRRALRAAVLEADPDAGKQRAEKGREDARVEAWQEGSGNGGLAGRELPAAEAIAADARIGQLARALKAGGAAGTLDQLRAAVFLALLLGRDPGDLLPASTSPDLVLGGTSGLGGVVHLTLPALTWLGLADRPGELAGLGAIDAHTGRDLAVLLAGSGKAAWHVTLTNGQGQAVAHACARDHPAADDGLPRATGPPGAARAAWLAGLAFEWLERDSCTHRRQTTAYQPGKSLRHLLQIRNPVCAAPGCRHPARWCDNEHTIPHDQGGKTCECNCAPVCRRHHQVKQSAGWQLTQPRPGHLAWTTPAGRTYRTQPENYPV